MTFQPQNCTSYAWASCVACKWKLNVISRFPAVFPPLLTSAATAPSVIVNTWKVCENSWHCWYTRALVTFRHVPKNKIWLWICWIGCLEKSRRILGFHCYRYNFFPVAIKTFPCNRSLSVWSVLSSARRSSRGKQLPWTSADQRRTK